jgi:hypothetical protein
MPLVNRGIDKINSGKDRGRVSGVLIKPADKLEDSKLEDSEDLKIEAVLIKRMSRSSNPIIHKSQFQYQHYPRLYTTVQRGTLPVAANVSN